MSRLFAPRGSGRPSGPHEAECGTRDGATPPGFVRWGHLRLRPAGLLALLALLACATKADVRELEEALILALARQDSIMQELSQLQGSTQDTVEAQSEALFQMRGDVNRQLLDIQDQLITLQELAGQNQRTIAAMRDQLEQQRQSQILLMPPGGGSSDPSAESDEARQMYEAGVNNYNRGSLNTARRAFEELLTTFPGHELAPSAQYYLADILVQENRLDEAVEAFERIPERYPTAERVPYAIYRAGLLQIDLGNQEEARASLERVVNSYPESDVAELARERLAEIR